MEPFSYGFHPFFCNFMYGHNYSGSSTDLIRAVILL